MKNEESEVSFSNILTGGISPYRHLLLLVFSFCVSSCCNKVHGVGRSSCGRGGCEGGCGGILWPALVAVGWICEREAKEKDQTLEK